MFCMGHCFYTDMETQETKCGWQFFMDDIIPLDKLREVITLAYMHSEMCGPVVMICTEHGYDFMVRNNLDELYIDFGICDTSESVWGMVSHLKETKQLVDEDVINNLENCSENILTLYNLFVPPDALEVLVDRAIEKETARISI